ncbi:hypothetical protein QVD99_008496 [Batrachochytrium dendrobatidis]|nr:hypothetical protein O5D80_007365 [Batrachochytrium dendrobatidis]KAK5664958.1 hypothetical protein QVD99_008496 [Batrachochytrium dendrobatidis]
MATVKLVTTPEELKEAHRVRYLVFAVEQGFDASIDVDEIDPKCTHWLLLPEETSAHESSTTASSVSGSAMGTVRMVPTEPCPSLGRLCVLETARGMGGGLKLVQAVHEHAKSKGFDRLQIHSQYDKVDFYSKAGYKVDDPEPFDEEGMPHFHMSIDLV